MLVSVCVITYNHEKFIRETIDGILMQITDFDFEIIISNDHSTDNTDSIISECIKESPQLKSIQYFVQEQNIGMQNNFIFALEKCSGRFIAICEGDDYWIDPYKLQKQVDYISQANGCNLVFTNFKSFNQIENKFYASWAKVNKKKYGFADIIKGNMIGTCTVLFRNPGKVVLRDWIKQFKIGDYPLYLLLLRSGYAYYVNEITAVYRQHTGGAFSLKGSLNQIDTHLNILQTILTFPLLEREHFVIRKSLVKWKYARCVRMSNDLEFKGIGIYIKNKIKLTDFIYYPSFFIRLILIFIFPRSKKGAFK
jgi:glycosyltransferase involved in cell wall biosynthesis